MEAIAEGAKSSTILRIDGQRLTGIPNRLHTMLSGTKLSSISARRNHFTGLSLFALSSFDVLLCHCFVLA